MRPSCDLGLLHETLSELKPFFVKFQVFHRLGPADSPGLGEGGFSRHPKVWRNPAQKMLESKISLSISRATSTLAQPRDRQVLLRLRGGLDNSFTNNSYSSADTIPEVVRMAMTNAAVTTEHFSGFDFLMPAGATPSMRTIIVIVALGDHFIGNAYGFYPLVLRIDCWNSQSMRHQFAPLSFTFSPSLTSPSPSQFAPLTLWTKR
jgi:hypothetical protein